MTRTLLKIFSLPFIIFLTISLICLIKDIPPQIFTRDPLDLVGAYPWLGLISNFGVLVWTAGAAIAFFSASAPSTSDGNREYVRFLYFGGAITLLFALDDLYMLHDYVFPTILHIHQFVTFAVYAALLFWYVFRFRTLILKNEPNLLILSFVLFGLSVGIDLFPLEKYNWIAFGEDIPKIFGIVSWTAYFTLFSRNALLQPAAPAKTNRRS